MERKVKTIKLCVNCSHLWVIGEGQEIEGLADTQYIETSCNVFNTTVKEHYQFPVEQGPLILDAEKCGNTDCPFWEPWDLSQKVLEEKKVAHHPESDKTKLK
ncbi:MAG: hypothetical protein NTY09_05745 [bacterium]|nr:hypothetical protein [bacterium]